MTLVRLMPKLRPIFPYECEIPADPASMYSSSGGHSRTGSPSVVQFVGFLGRIRFTPQDEKAVRMDDIQLFRKIQLIITNYRTQFSHTDVYKFCVIIACLPIHQMVLKFSSYFIEIEWWQSFSLHISAKLHLAIFGIWGNNIQSMQYVICVMIVRVLWHIGLAIRYAIWIVAHLCTSRDTFLRINGKTTLSPVDPASALRSWCSNFQS